MKAGRAATTSLGILQTHVSRNRDVGHPFERCDYFASGLMITSDTGT